MPRRDAEVLSSYIRLISQRDGGIEATIAKARNESVLEGAVESAATTLRRPLAQRALEKIALGRGLEDAEVSAAEALIIPEKRPAVPIRDGTFTVGNPEWRHLSDNPAIRSRLEGVIPSVGRIELPGTSRIPYAGTGFVVGTSLLMTNRHVAQIFAAGIGDRQLTFRPGMRAEVDFLRELDRPSETALVVGKVVMIHPYWDMAILAVTGLDKAHKPLRLSTRDARQLTGTEIVVVGYPYFDTRNPEDQQNKLFEGKYGYKRLQPGALHEGWKTASFGKQVEAATHDCSTLGGNSGSAIFDVATGEVLALHFGGHVYERNFGVPTFELSRDARVVDTGINFSGAPSRGPNGWDAWWAAADEASGEASEDGAKPSLNPPSAPPAPPSITTMKSAGTATIDVPLQITLSIGVSVSAATPAAVAPVTRSETPLEDGQEALVEPFHDTNYAERKGYDSRFLGTIDVPIPGAADTSVLAPTRDGGDTLRYENFSIRMHAARRLALITASNVTKEPSLRRPEPGRSYTRKSLTGLGPNDFEKWFPDPRLDEKYQLPDAFFNRDRGAFDKGHLVRRDDIAWGATYNVLRRANGDSYHLTNCSPQVASFNRSDSGIDNWGDLENVVLAGASTERLCIFAGPMLDSGDTVFVGKGRDGRVLRSRIPSRFWKVVVARIDEGIGAFGFIISQDLGKVDWEFAVPPEFVAKMAKLTQIEAAAGITLAPVIKAGDQFDTVWGEKVRVLIGDRPSAEAVNPAPPAPPARSAAPPPTTPPTRASPRRQFETLLPLPSPVAVSGDVDARSFSLASLRNTEFTWPTALSLALTSRLAYESRDSVERRELREWGFADFNGMSSPGMQGFAAFADDVMLIAFCGTNDLSDWLYNLDMHVEVRPYGSVHRGFLNAFRLLEPSLRGQLANAGARKVWLTGHSLGGALATLAAAEIDIPNLAGVYTFGQPRTMKGAAATDFDNRFSGRHLRFVNNRDLVTRVPPGFVHVGRLVHFDANGGLADEGIEALGSGGEPPTYTEAQFERLKEQIGRLKRAANTSNRMAEESITSSSVEGLIPGLSDHNIGRYIANIANFSTHADADPTIEAEYSVRMMEEGLESAGGSTPSRRTTDNIPILIKVRSKDWTPPPGVRITSRLGHVWSAQVPHAAIQGLRKDTGVVSFELSREGGRPELAKSVPHVRGELVHRPPVNELGDAALVGLVDTGIDILHRAFRSDDSANARNRILAIWNQQDDTSPSPHSVDPDHFEQDYGTLYLKNQIDGFIASGGRVPTALRDPRQHGTHVASIAAGRRCGLHPNTNEPRMADGMAPEAGIVVVIPKMSASPGDPVSLGYSNSHADAIAFLQTVSLGGNAVLESRLPMAVNLSIGMNAGGHDGASLLELGIDSCTNGGDFPGFVIVKSAGNERVHHGHQRITATLGIVTIDWTSSDDPRRRDYFEVWYSHFDDLSFILEDPAGHRSALVSADMRREEVDLGGNVCSLDLTLLQGGSGDHRLTMTITANANGIQPGPWKLLVEGRRLRSERRWVDIWVERDDEARAVRFSPSTPEVTLSIPGTADTVICVAACEARDPLIGISASSYGPTRTGEPKPEISAPGLNITAALANTQDREAVIASTGTSMAAPHVTGALALALSARHKQPDRQQHNAVRLRSAITSTARHFNQHHAGTGYGLLDSDALLRYLDTV